MPDIRPVTPEFAVSPQLAISDLAGAKARGFELIINNRPDGEAPDQPSGAEIEAAARAEGLDYRHVPVVGRPTAEQAKTMAESSRGRKTLAFCRSGTRSILTWALGRVAAGDDLVRVLRLAADAGYDLRGAFQ